MDKPKCPALTLGRPGCDRCVWREGGSSWLCREMVEKWERKRRKAAAAAQVNLVKVLSK